MSKKKLHFYQLTIVFGTIVTLTLLYNWGNNGSTETGSSMMGQSMGKMMSSMHLKNVTLKDLINGESQKNMNMNRASDRASGSDTSSHHESGSDFMKVSNLLTTGTIIVLLPFIIAGSIFLAIIWIK